MILIAELGSSPAAHGWQLTPWLQAAKESGATHVKVQLFRAEHFPESERAAKKPLEFPRDKYALFCRMAHERELLAGTSVFDDFAVGLAVLEGDFLKLAAREQENEWLMRRCERNRDRLYRSISRAKSYRDWPRFTLWTVQRYPTPMWIALWGLFRSQWVIPAREWGWSSHTVGWLDCLWAARLGANVIEKHLALSTDDLEAGHSLLPAQFKRMAEKMQ